MSDIFQEVEEEVRQERAQALWKRYGPYVVAAALGLVIAVASVNFWRSYQQSAREASGDQFLAALEALEAEPRDPAAAAEALAGVEADGADSYPLLAQFARAEALVGAQGADAAVALYDEIAAGAGTDLMRDLARIKAAALVLENDAEAALSRLAPLAQAPDGAFRHLAEEYRAAALVKTGELEQARAALDALSREAAAPNGVRSRAAEWLTALGAPAASE